MLTTIFGSLLKRYTTEDLLLIFLDRLESRAVFLYVHEL